MTNLIVIFGLIPVCEVYRDITKDKAQSLRKAFLKICNPDEILECEELPKEVRVLRGQNEITFRIR